MGRQEASETSRTEKSIIMQQQSMTAAKVSPSTQHLFPNGKMTCAF